MEREREKEREREIEREKENSCILAVTASGSFFITDLRWLLLFMGSKLAHSQLVNFLLLPTP
jgi:hypothetical protein